MRTRSYILTGIIAYFLFLITTIPAGPVIRMFEERLPVTISNISGTLWNGRAGVVNIPQKVSLQNVRWSFLPSRLLLASAALDVSAELNDKPLNARLSAGVTGRLALDDLQLKLDADDVQPLIALPIGKLSGVFELNINSATFRQGEVPLIDGTIDWNQAAVTVAETAELGNVSILVNERDESPLAARISNKGGDLAINGDFTTTPEGQYALKLNMKPGATASDNLVSSLSMFARKQRNGEFLINNTGNLAQLGLM